MKSAWFRSRIGVRGSNLEQREGGVKGGWLVKGTGTKLTFFRTQLCLVFLKAPYQ